MAKRLGDIVGGEAHIHSWGPGHDRSERRCMGYTAKGLNCPAILVSPREHEYRMAEWNAYFDLVKTTDAYRDYQAMREAVNTKNKPLMAEIMKRNLEACDVVLNEWGDEVLKIKDPLPNPHYPDPVGFPYYVIYTSNKISNAKGTT